jgi:multicomponent K+:H+ antiporter subunit D
MYTLVFGPEAPTGAFFADLLLPAALVTLVLGALGVLAARRLPRLLGFAVLASTGTLLIAVALFDQVGLSAALYYLVHSTLATAALFLVADMVRQGPEGAVPHGLVAGFYFAAAIAMAGMPPLSGFFGKLLILDATAAEPWAVAIWATVLITSLVLIVGFTLRGSALFWSPAAIADAPRGPAPAPLSAVAAGLPLALLAALTIAAGPATRATDAIAAQLISPEPYIAAVLGEGG